MSDYSEIGIMCQHVAKAGLARQADGTPLANPSDIWNSGVLNSFAPYVHLLELYEAASIKLGVFHDGTPYRKCTDGHGLFWGCCREGDPEPDYAARLAAAGITLVPCTLTPSEEIPCSFP